MAMIVCSLAWLSARPLTNLPADCSRVEQKKESGENQPWSFTKPQHTYVVYRSLHF